MYDEMQVRRKNSSLFIVEAQVWILFDSWKHHINVGSAENRSWTREREREIDIENQKDVKTNGMVLARARDRQI